MIELDIVESPDLDTRGSFRTFKTFLLVGRSLRNDIIIDDPKISSYHLEMEVTDKGLLCGNIKGTPFFHSCGKNVSGADSSTAHPFSRAGPILSR